MPVFIGWLMAALETRIGSIVVQLLLSLGISFVSYKFGVDPLRTFISSQLQGMGRQAVDVIGFLGFDQAITMVLSAMAAHSATKGMSAVLTRKGSAA